MNLFLEDQKEQNVKTTLTSRKINYIKACVYGDAGVGKTVLCGTTPRPLLISAEAGLLSLADKDVPVIEISSFKELSDCYDFLLRDKEYETICIDSLSEIAEMLLCEYKAKENDPRKAYGRMADDMTRITKSFRDMDKHVVVTAKQTLLKDEYLGKINYIPYMPGKAFTQQVAYYFDLVLCMRASKKGERFLQTQPDISYLAKDRSGKLSQQEEPDLTAIFNKILKGENNATITK